MQSRCYFLDNGWGGDRFDVHADARGRKRQEAETATVGQREVQGGPSPHLWTPVRPAAGRTLQPAQRHVRRLGVEVGAEQHAQPYMGNQIGVPVTGPGECGRPRLLAAVQHGVAQLCSFGPELGAPPEPQMGRLTCSGRLKRFLPGLGPQLRGVLVRRARHAVQDMRPSGVRDQ